MELLAFTVSPYRAALPGTVAPQVATSSPAQPLKSPAVTTLAFGLLAARGRGAWRRCPTSRAQKLIACAGGDSFHSRPVPHGGPTVIISGGSQGVGRATALNFARGGYNVVLAARNPEALSEAETLCREAMMPQRKVMSFGCDITSKESMKQLHERVVQHFSDIRVVVCNAGVCMTGEVMATSLEDFQSQLDVNFLGHVSTVQAFLPQLLKQAGQRGPAPTVCFVNSFGARVPLPDMTAYCAAKYALQGFADSLRIELSQKGVHVATVHPGVIRSDFRQRAQWRGSAADGRKSTMDSLLDSESPVSGVVTQSVEEVADATYEAITKQQTEVVVGTPFRTMIAAYGVGKAMGLA
mmetsp:Transcript_17991/g.40572  ORF Transcript_17991/g.40572 Transcript_17991/m.40572 type:complete len:353 (+) Transcript_17991:56-1114(+)